MSITQPLRRLGANHAEAIKYLRPVDLVTLVGETAAAALEPLRATSAVSVPEPLRRLREFVDVHAHAHPHHLTVTADGYRIGRRTAALRERYADSHEHHPMRLALEALPHWFWDGSTPSARAFQFARGGKASDVIAEAAVYAEKHGHLVTRRNEPLGYRLNRLREVYDLLTETDRARLDAIEEFHLDPEAPDVASEREQIATARRRAAAVVPAWDRSFARLEAYVDAHGTALVPRTYVDASGYALGEFVAQLRSLRRSGRRHVDEWQIAAVEALPGWSWSPREDRAETLFTERVRQAHAHVATTGALPGSRTSLGRWLASQARHHERHSPSRRAALEAIPSFAWRTPAPTSSLPAVTVMAA